MRLSNDFELLLQEFNELIKESPTASKIKAELTEMKDFAITASALNGRQRDAISERCLGYLNGTYGKNLSKVSN
jgi:hypothetical protein